MKIQKKVKQKRNLFVDIVRLFVRKYYIYLILVGCVAFVGVFAVYKTYVSKPLYLYAKVKVGQGYWWASTQRPNQWFVNAIRNARVQNDLAGKPIAQVLRVDYYPYYGTNQFDVYVTLKLKVTKVGNKGMYNFNRDMIGVAVPIDLEFPNVQFSGTIIELSEKPISSKLVAKTIYLTKKYSYPWEFDEIKVGDKFNNGHEDVIKIIDKAKSETNEVIRDDQGKLISSDVEKFNYITLKVKIMVRAEESRYVYGEETILLPIRGFDFITDGYIYNNFTIAKIE